VLNLSSNFIQEIPVIIVKNTNLCELYLSNNTIVNSDSINHLENLEKLHILDLSQNPICELLNYPYFVIQVLKKLYYLDGNVISKFVKRPSFNRSLKAENNLSNTLQFSQSIASSQSNGLINNHFLEIEKASSKYLFEEGQNSVKGRNTHNTHESLRNGRPHSMGGAEFALTAPSQRSTITGAHRMSSVGSVEPIEENILYENSYVKDSELKMRNNKNVPDLKRRDRNIGQNKENWNMSMERSQFNVSNSLLNNDKENSIMNYHNNVNKVPETPALDELLQTSLLKNLKNNTTKAGSNKHRTQSQEYPDPFYQAMEDVKGFVNRIKMDKNKEMKNSFNSKLQDGDLVSASVSQIGTPRAGKIKPLFC